jgi:hypothetical protein
MFVWDQGPNFAANSSTASLEFSFLVEAACYDALTPRVWKIFEREKCLPQTSALVAGEVLLLRCR